MKNSSFNNRRWKLCRLSLSSQIVVRVWNKSPNCWGEQRRPVWRTTHTQTSLCFLFLSFSARSLSLSILWIFSYKFAPFHFLSALQLLCLSVSLCRRFLILWGGIKWPTCFREWELPRLYRPPSPLTPGNFISHLSDPSQVWLQFNFVVGCLLKFEQKEKKAIKIDYWVLFFFHVWFGLDW